MVFSSFHTLYHTFYLNILSDCQCIFYFTLIFTTLLACKYSFVLVALTVILYVPFLHPFLTVTFPVFETEIYFLAFLGTV